MINVNRIESFKIIIVTKKHNFQEILVLKYNLTETAAVFVIGRVKCIGRVKIHTRTYIIVIINEQILLRWLRVEGGGWRVR